MGDEPDTANGSAKSPHGTVLRDNPVLKPSLLSVGSRGQTSLKDADGDNGTVSAGADSPRIGRQHSRGDSLDVTSSPFGPKRSVSYCLANAASLSLSLSGTPTEELNCGLPYTGNPKKIAEILGRTSDYLEVARHTSYFSDEKGYDFSDIEYESRIADPARPPQRGYNFHYIRWKVRRTVEHLSVRLLVFVLILLDISIVIMDLTDQLDRRMDERLAIISVVLSCFFLLEVSLRIFGVGPKYFFNFSRQKAWWNIIDFVVVVITFVTSLVDLAVEHAVSDGSKLVVILRIIRVIRLLRICAQQDQLKKAARQIISENKRRYQQDGFDLDLCYVTERVIAMSFPSSGQMSVYRNPIADVSRFFNTQHRDKYKLYNLCSERDYDHSYFNGNVQRIEIDDHNVPTLQQMLEFTRSVIDWLNGDPENVVAVHCKGGKGRTGTMICVYMVETGLFSTADASLDYFGSRRTDLNVGAKFQGVETPSQSRYVGYYEWMKNNHHHLPLETPRLLTRITITGLTTLGNGTGSDLSLVVAGRGGAIFEASCTTGRGCSHTYDKVSDVATITLSDCPVLTGDVQLKFKCSSRNVPRGYENVAFYFWFHTGFLEHGRLTLRREDLDNPHKPKTWDVYTEKFCVDCIFA